jgi:uncharacterized protein (DUF1501 family)
MARGCRDWEGSQAALHGRTGRFIPIPARALDGLSEFERGGLSRRDLLAGGVGLLLAAGGLPGLSTRGVLEAAAAQAADAPDAPILVSLYLDGGNDGLNTLVPVGDARYAQLRSRIGVDPASALPLADAPGFAWHPALAGLRELYDAGKVAVLPAVDYGHPDQSHFNSGGYWRSGIVGPAPDRTGWLGRTLDAIGTRDNPLQGIHVGWGQDPSLNARSAPVASVSSPSDFGFSIPDVWDEKAFLPTYRRLSRARAKHPGLAAVRSMYGNTIATHDRLAPLAKEDKPAPPPIAYPASDLGKGLGNLGRLLGAGFGTRVATVSSGGFDTHDAQAAAHADLLQDLGDSLRAWQADLDARGLSQRVLTMIWSEFGRRPEDNDSAGTDHGAGGLLLLVGNRANGGIRSEFPGLTRLDDDDNLVVTTDFRSVYANLLQDWLGVEASRVMPRIPGGTHLPLLRAA